MKHALEILVYRGSQLHFSFLTTSCSSKCDIGWLEVQKIYSVQTHGIGNMNEGEFSGKMLDLVLLQLFTNAMFGKNYLPRFPQSCFSLSMNP